MKVVLWVFFTVYMILFLCLLIAEIGKQCGIFKLKEETEDTFFNVVSLLREGFYAIVIGFVFCYLVGLIK